jgi:hypothetical protein
MECHVLTLYDNPFSVSQNLHAVTPRGEHFGSY